MALAVSCTAILLALSAAPARADLLDLLPGNEGTGIQLQNISLTGDGTLTIVTTALPDEILLRPDDLSPLLSLGEGGISLTLSLEPGFALTAAACSAGLSIVQGEGLEYFITLAGSQELVPEALACTFNTINAVGASLSAIVPMILRRNDVAMSLDLGLDRQIDLLAGDMNGNGDDEWDEAAAALNTTTTTAGFMSDEWSGPRYSLGASSMQSTEPSRIAFATSLQQSRKQAMPPPYALGAHSRPPAPAKGKVDVWAEGYYAEFEDDSAGFGLGSDGHTGVLYLGADYLITRTALIGALIQFDDTEQDFNFLSQRSSTNGWMAGPYATVRLPYNLFFQARAAWGQSDNELTVAPGFEDEFESERWLVKGTLLGQYKHGLWQIRPRASVGYIEEDQEAYTSSLGPDIPSTTVSLGQAKAGSQFAYRHRLADGSLLEPSVLLEGICNFHEEAGQINLDDFVTDGRVRGRTEAGLTLYTVSGVAVSGSISYDGIGSDDFSSVGGRARVKVPLN